MRNAIRILVASSLALAATSAYAADDLERPPALGEPPPSSTVVKRHDRIMEPWFLVGARAGVVIPEAFNKLFVNFLVEVEGAYQLPFWHRRVGLFVGLSYSQPTESGAHLDPRVMTNGGNVTYNMTVQDLGFDFGAQLRWAIGRWVVPYGGIGARVHFTHTIVDQAAGTTNLGENTEQSTRVGFLARLGCGVHLGPGDLVGELQIDYTPVDHLITGDNNTGHLAFQFGYLLRL